MIKDQGRKVTWSVWAVLAQWPLNRKWIVVVSPKLAGGYLMTHATLRTSFKVKRSKVRVTGWSTQTQNGPYLPNGKAYELQSWCADGGRWPASRQAPWPPRLKVKVTSSHRLYVSHLPLLNSGNKMLYLCTCVIRGGHGDTMSAEPGGHTSCSNCNKAQRS